LELRSKHRNLVRIDGELEELGHGTEFGALLQFLVTEPTGIVVSPDVVGESWKVDPWLSGRADLLVFATVLSVTRTEISGDPKRHVGSDFRKPPKRVYDRLQTDPCAAATRALDLQLRRR